MFYIVYSQYKKIGLKAVIKEMIVIFKTVLKDYTH